jgi:hypothetical protein
VDGTVGGLQARTHIRAVLCHRRYLTKPLASPTFKGMLRTWGCGLGARGRCAHGGGVCDLLRMLRAEGCMLGSKGAFFVQGQER